VNSIASLIVSSDDLSMKLGQIERWNEVVDSTLEEFGMLHSTRIVALHSDGSTPHAHGLLSFFKVEYCLEGEKFSFDDHKKTSKKEFNKTYKSAKAKLKKKCKAVAGKVEREFDLQKDSINIHIGKDRYINPLFSIKHQLQLAYKEAIAQCQSFKEFLVALPGKIERKMKELANRAKSHGRKALLNFIGSADKISLQLKKSPIKKINECILVTVNNFKISDYKIGKGLDIQSIKEYFENKLDAITAAGSQAASWLKLGIAQSLSKYFDYKGLQLGGVVPAADKEKPAAQLQASITIEKSQESHRAQLFQWNSPNLNEEERKAKSRQSDLRVSSRLINPNDQHDDQKPKRGMRF
jgi:hypothetical protein